jgi:hypothetical protein
MLFLRFQDTLAAEQWQEALSFCSDRVRAKAAEWPSPKAFFNETLPTELLLAQDFGYWTVRSDQTGGFEWTDKANFYGLFVTLTEPESKPEVQWYWAIYATNNTWVIDYPPVKMDEYIAKKRRAIREREDRFEQIRHSLEPKARGIDARLTAVSQRFVIGSPMLFRVELANRGNTPVHYKDSGVAFAPLTVRDDKNQPLSFTRVPLQIRVQWGEVGPDASAVLADKIDLNLQYAITMPGKYFVQFSGADLEIGEPVPHQDWGPFGENEIVSDFVAATNRFPSNVIKIEVTAKKRQ